MASPKSRNCPQDNLLSCPICMDTYKTPRMLPCQHTLCEGCLHSYIVNKSKERVLVSDFPCPVCRASTPAPRAFTRIDTWSTLFPLNHLLVSLLDSNFQEIMDNREVAGDKCPEHSAKLIEFFCTEHNQKLCSKCFKNSHRQCDIIDIEDHIEFTSRFNTVKVDVDNVNTYLNHVISHLRTNIEQLALQKGSILTEVKDFRGKVEALLNTFETDIKDHVGVQHDGEMVVLKAQCEKYERIKAEIEVSENSLNQLPITGNISQSLESINSIESEIKSHLSFLNGCHSNLKLTKLEFAIESELITFLNSFHQIGKVQVSYFEASLKPPPELLPRENTPTDSSVTSSSELSITPTHDHSPKSVHHRSPRSVVNNTRPSVSTTSQMTQITVGTQPCRTPPRTTKEQKRPLTVPIESTAPTPIVRPRPERPDVRCIPHFIPRTFSSPVPDQNNADGSVRDSVAQTDSDNNTDHANELPPQHSMHTLEMTVSTAVPASPKISNNSTITSTLLDRRHSQGGRVWHYVNVRPEQLDSIASHDGTTCTPSSESSEQPACLRIRHRIGSLSDASVGNNNNTPPSSESNVVSRMVRSFQEPSKTSKPSDTSPLYENTTSGSFTTYSSSSNRKSLDRKVDYLSHAESASRKCFKVSETCIRIQQDMQECTVTCSVELHDHRLVLIDCNNSRVKLFSRKLEYVAHADMPMEPWNTAVLAQDEIAVTIPLGKVIHVLRLLENSMELMRRIETRRECWGICYIDGKIITTTKDDGNSIVFLDKSGRELQIVNFATRENPHILRPVSMSTRRHDSVIYVSCEGQSGTKGSVTKMSLSGEVLQVLTYKDLDRPYSTTADDRNNLYVAALRSANVTLIPENGGQVETLLSKDSGLSRPQHIQLMSKEGSITFLLSERRSDHVVMYEVK